MKLSLKLLLVVSAVALASQSSLVLANGEAVSTSDAVPVQSDAVEADAPGADVDGDAGKECDADDCESSEETEPATPGPVVEEAKEPEDPKCPSRPHIIRCAAKYLDTNQNGALERSELEAVMDSVPWLLRSLLNIIGSVDTIMKKCDADGDGAITIEQDMEATKETCLASCFKRNAFKRLMFPDCTE